MKRAFLSSFPKSFSESAFQEGFAELPWFSRVRRLVSLSLLLLAFILLLAPASYHRIVEAGADIVRLHRFTSTVVGGALVPFAVSMTMDLYVGPEPWKVRG